MCGKKTKQKPEMPISFSKKEVIGDLGVAVSVGLCRKNTN
jgi:hypothetical protein